MIKISGPNHQDAPHWYASFFRLISGDDLLAALEENRESMLELLDGIPMAAIGYRYAPGKWTIKQVFIHLADEERYYAYKAFCYSRRSPAQLEVPMGPPYTDDFNDSKRTLADIRDELIAVRRASITLFRTMTPEMLDFSDLPSKERYSARSLGWFTVAHNIHHLNLIKEKYLTTWAK